MALTDDIRELTDEVKALNRMGETQKQELNILHEQINGARGISAAINELAAEVHSLRKAAYWLAGLIVTGSVGFAFSVLTFLQ